MIESASLLAVAPELVLTVGGLALMLVAAWGGEASSRVVNWLAVLTLALAGVALSTSLANGPVAFDGLVRADAFSAFAKGMIYAAAAAAILLAPRYFQTDGRERPEYPVLILFSAIGMGMMVSAGDLLTLYVGLEMQSLAAYVLASFMRQDARSSEAGLKYFVLGSLASGILLYGSALLYGFTGTTAFDGIAVAMGDGVSNGELFGMVFLLAGLAFKMSAVPFHMWTPDVYEGAPTPVTAFFSVAPKIAALALFIRVMVVPFGGLVGQWQQIVIFISIASMVLGALAAINQRNIKRLMAYSSIGHVGYALIGLAVGGETGVASVLIYLAIYLFMTIGVFACILCMRRDGTMVEGIDDLAGMSRSHPMLALALAIFMFSMAGIPPFAGFFGKLYIFLGAIEAELYGLAVLGVLASVVGAFYYIRIVQIVYFEEADEPLDKNPGKELVFVIAAAGVFIAFFFVYPTPVLSAAAAAAAALFAG